MQGRWERSDAKWKLLEPSLRPKRRADGRGRPWQDTRVVLHGVLWVLGTGAPWREMPKKYPPYQTCYRRFQQWVREGKLQRILRVLAETLRAQGKLDLARAWSGSVWQARLVCEAAVATIWSRKWSSKLLILRRITDRNRGFGLAT